MANKQALRDLQTRLAERSAEVSENITSRFLNEGRFMHPAKGGVFTVVDLARFLGLRQEAPAAQLQARLVAFNAALGIHGALMVDRLEGLRHAADLQAADESTDNAARPAFALARWRDAAGRWWQEIDLAALARSPQFLAITA